MSEKKKSIIEKFRMSAWDSWWGDFFDVRFYLADKLANVHKESILDVGCGLGIILSEIPGDNLKVGLDISQKTIKIARMMAADSAFVVCDMHRMPFRKNSFNRVIVANSFSRYDFFIDQRIRKEATPKKLLLEIPKIMKRGGYLFLTTPNGGHASYRTNRKVRYHELHRLLSTCFSDFQIHGFNPFPDFITRTLGKVCPTQFMKLLVGLTKFKTFRSRGKFFFAQAHKGSIDLKGGVNSIKMKNHRNDSIDPTISRQ